MTDSRSARKKRQDEAVRQAIEKLSVSMASHPAVRCQRLFVFLSGDHGPSSILQGFDEDALEALIAALQALRKRGLDADIGTPVEVAELPDFPENVIAFPGDRGWD